jgi:hypothetical protein
MTVNKSLLLALGTLMFNLLAARAGEFPDDWT